MIWRPVGPIDSGTVPGSSGSSPSMAFRARARRSRLPERFARATTWVRSATGCRRGCALASCSSSRLTGPSNRRVWDPPSAIIPGMIAVPLDDQSRVLLDVVDRLEREGIEYMISGSIALSAYVRPRMTRDIDVVVDVGPHQVDALLRAFHGDYYLDAEAAGRAVAEHRLVNAVHESTLVKVDLVIRKEGPFRTAEFDRRVTVTVHGREMRLVSPEDLLLSKLLWGADSGSAVQFDDARQLAALKLDWRYVERWATALELVDAVERLRR